MSHPIAIDPNLLFTQASSDVQHRVSTSRGRVRPPGGASVGAREEQPANLTGIVQPLRIMG